MARKTVDLATLVNMVNDKNRLSTCSADVRHGWNSLLSQVLMAADAYAGFGYLTAGQVPPGHLPGIHRDRDGATSFPDESRVFYYLHHSLREAHPTKKGN